MEVCSGKLGVAKVAVFLSLVVGMERKEDTRWECGVSLSVYKGIFSLLIRIMGRGSVLEYEILTEFAFRKSFPSKTT